MSDYILYILMRTDLPSMNPGKAMAQASHASNQFIHSIRVDNQISSELESAVEEWESQTDSGFGTVLVLGCTYEEMYAVYNSIQDSIHDNVYSEIVIDPTYPYIVDSEILPLIRQGVHSDEPKKIENKNLYVCFRTTETCAFAFGKKIEMEKHLGLLKLHP